MKSPEILHYDIDEGDYSLYRHEEDGSLLRIYGDAADVDLTEARELVRRANEYPHLLKQLRAIVEPVAAAFGLKTQELIFGGDTPEERMKNYEIYKGNIQARLITIPEELKRAQELLRRLEG